MPLLGLKTILGTNQFGGRAAFEECRNIVTTYLSSEEHTWIDTASLYGNGKCEEYLGSILPKSKPLSVFTKASAFGGYSLSAEGVRSQLEGSLKRLKRESVEEFYLHSFDRDVSLQETLGEVNALYEEGKFSELGLSNYTVCQIEEVYNICKENSWVLPKVCQGVYSAIVRISETELIPCIRSYGMRFYAYSPLSGGLLTGKHRFDDIERIQRGEFLGQSRFFEEGFVPKVNRERYWKSEYFEGIEAIKQVIKEIYGNDVTILEAAYRWLHHHSMLSSELGDGILVGSASNMQLQENLEHTKKNELDSRVVDEFDKVWNKTKHFKFLSV